MKDHSFLIEKLKSSYYTDEEISIIIEGLSKPKITSFRVNLLKDNIKNIIKIFNDLDIKYTLDENFKDAVLLNGVNSISKVDINTGIDIKNLSIYKDGHIYMQSLSSMIPVIVIKPQKNENILDMCAAPGSKTTMVQSISKNTVNLTAVELHKDRFERLKYNCDKQGANVLLLNQNALDLNDMFKFDKILLDAPCSGSGILDLNDGNYEKYFTNKLIDKCVSTQKRLIKKSLKLLKPGGTLIYSTCSLLKEENEDIVDYAVTIGYDLDFIVFNVRSNNFAKGSSVNEKVYMKVLPNEMYEGFFVAKLVKPLTT